MNYTPPTILKAAPPGWFFFNNSSLEDESCSLRYVYKQVLGRVVSTSSSKDESLTIGSCLHDILERITPSHKEFDFHFNPDHVSKYKQQVDTINPLVYTTLVELAVRIFQSEPNWFADCLREYKFCIYDDRTLVARGRLYNETQGAIWCGTIDLLSFENDWVIIRDYKSTKKKLTGDHVDSYKLKSQPHFYKESLLRIARYLPHTLPPHYIDAINNQRIKFGYVHVSYTDKNYIAPSPQPINMFVFEHFQKLFADRQNLARALHDTPNIALKDGMLANQCWRCNYANICSENDSEKEQQRIERLPIKLYNPLIRET